MSTVIEQPRNDVPIVADTTLLTVPNMNDESARTEYLKRIRALRSNSAEAAPAPALQPTTEEAETPETSPAITEDLSIEDATPEPAKPEATGRTRLSREDLHDYEIPVTDEDGTVQYLSYDEFEKTVGLYSKQNKRARELAEREREVEALKTKLVSETQTVMTQVNNVEAHLAERYQWVQNSLAFAHQHGVDEVKFDDGTKKRVTQLIAEKTALENRYTELQRQKQEAQQKLEAAQQDFIRAQDKVLQERAPNVLKSRADITGFLERQGFTSEEAKALTYAKAELLMIFDKAMRYENAQRSQPKEKKVATNTMVIKQPSRLAGRGTPQATVASGRMQELQSKGTRASADELRELRRLQLQHR